MKIIRWGAVLGAVAALALATPAAAEDETPPSVPWEVWQTDGCELTILAANPTGTTAWLVIDVDGVAETVELPAGGDAQAGPYRLDEVSVQYRIFGGGERDYDSPQWSIARPDLLDYLAEHGDEWVLGAVAEVPEFVGWHQAAVEGCAPATTAPATTAPATTAPATTAPATTAPAGESPAPGAGAELPTTGVPTWGLAAAGGVLLLAGTGAVLVGRRRRRMSFTA